MPRGRPRTDGITVTVKLAPELYKFVQSKTKTEWGNVSLGQVISNCVRKVMDQKD